MDSRTDLECRFCGAMNDPEERRCLRCGRRLHLAASRPLPDVYPIASAPLASGSMTAAAIAPVLERYHAPSAAPESRELPSPMVNRGAYQPPLFPGASPKVIPIPTIAPMRPLAREASPARRAYPRTAPRPGGMRPRRESDPQQTLGFREPAPNANPAGARGGPYGLDTIYCDAPVASPMHRAMAYAVDLSMVLMAVGAFLAIFFISGGNMVLNRHTLPLLLGVVALITMFYRMLWCLANADTPGMRLTRLRLVNFDGRPPDREQRGIRQIAGILSLASAGLGLMWACVDEEKLTWHDHISKTFPTPVA